jgi:hypothetical protein
MRDANIAWWPKFRPINSAVAELGDTTIQDSEASRRERRDEGCQYCLVAEISSINAAVGKLSSSRDAGLR